MTQKKPSAQTKSTARRATTRAALTAEISDTPPALAVPSTPQLFPLQQLRRAPENVRHTRIDEDVETLADDIAAHGLLQSLIGYAVETPDRDPAEPLIYVVGGGRRFQALRMLEDRGAIAGGFQVPVLVRDVADAVELSLAENLQQRTMSPVDEFFAFRALMETGANSPATLAARFGFSERIVKQRLRLAELDADILDALAERKITIDAAMAYATSQDPALQRAVFKAHSKPNTYDAHKPDRVRRDLRSQGKDTADPLYKFIGAETYEAAGGGYEDDLFNEVGKERVLSHPHLIEQLAHDRVGREYGRLLPEWICDPELAATITGYVKIPDLRLHSWGTQAKLTNPDGFEKIDRWDHAKTWNTIRNNAIEAKVLVGINADGKLTVWPRIVFVPADQKQAVDPTQPMQRGYVPPTPEEVAAAEREKGVETWSRRLAIGPFAGTPLEGRAFWPQSWHDYQVRTAGPGADGNLTDGWLVPVYIFVSDAAIAEQLQAAEAKYDTIVAERAAKEAKKKADAAAAEKRRGELEAIEPPAVVIIDGQPWVRDEDGQYAPVGEDEDPFSDWEDVLESADLADVGETYATREAFDQALRAAQTEDEAAPAAREEEPA